MKIPGIGFVTAVTVVTEVWDVGPAPPRTGSPRGRA